LSETLLTFGVKAHLLGTRHGRPKEATVLSQKFIVIPYKKSRGGMTPGEIRQASNAVSAERIATAMADRHPVIAAYSVMVDTETGDMTSPELIISFGDIPPLEE
jgi:hypothetical protein